MKRTARALSHALFALALLAIAMPASALDRAAVPTDDELAERQALAARQPLFDRAGVPPEAATASQLVEALDIPPGIVTGSSLTGSSAATAVFPSLGVLQPKQGTTLALLSSGVAGTSAPEPGVDFPPFGVAGDTVVLTIDVDVPMGANRLTFDYNFLSAEFPDFVGSVFNDTFTAELTDANGTRTIASASVNSSFFFAASGSRAAGTGFDIFTEDPSGVDTDFSGGLPDAGVTDWQKVDVAIADGGPATLVFRIGDRGDGILDSAVVLDSVVITSLEAVDPNPALLDGAEVSTDPETLATGGETVEGAAADGVTRVLLRTTVPSSGMVEFTLEDATAPEDGGLSQVGGTDRLSSVLVPTDETAEGFQAFATYLVPEDFNRGGDDGLRERPIKFKARFLPDNGDELENELPFKLVRPPVVLIHGLWSDGGTWGFGLATDSRFETTIADYKGTHARFFSTNLLVPARYINEALDKMRDDKIAVTQADLGGHSMGGILSRNHVGRSTYKKNANYDEGDVDKLVTLNTPHTGSPLANVLAVVRDILPQFLLDKLRDFGKAIDEGAIDDLSKGSAAINAIQQTPVPSHALVGIGGSDLVGDALTLLPGGLGLLFKILNFFDDNTDIFAGIQHDLIVGRPSQEGGMPSSAYTVFDGLGSIHTAVTSNSAYSQKAIELYNTAVDDSSFSEFPAPSSLFVEPFLEDLSRLRAAEEGRARAVIPDGLVITSPADGAIVASGSVLQVTVAAQNGFVPVKVMILTPAVAEISDEPPFDVELPLPVEGAGELEMVAIGLDANGDITSSASIFINLDPNAALTGVTIVNRDPVLFLGESRRIFVSGSYADGISRDITGSSAGTQYLTSGPSIFTVSPDGIVTGTAEGIATLVARNSGLQDSISVTVEEVPLDTTPPVIENLTADPNVLWPPNHKMRPVAISVEATDDSGEEPACEITLVTSSEPVTGPGDTTSPDWIVTGPLSVDLRAERLGSGDGRIYTIEVTCTDEAGNQASSTVEVLVPHDQGN